MLTLTRQGLLLSLSATVIPSQGSSDVPVSVTNDQSTYVGYTLEPRVGYYLNGIYKSIVCVYDSDTKTFDVPAEVFKQNGVIDITLALIDNTNANHIETCQAVHATINKAPLGTVILPDQTTWQEYVRSYTQGVLNDYTTTTINPLVTQAQQAVTTANQASQNANEASENVQTAYNNLGNYKVENGVIYFMKADGTYNTQGVTLAGQTTVNLNGARQQTLNLNESRFSSENAIAVQIQSVTGQPIWIETNQANVRIINGSNETTLDSLLDTIGSLINIISFYGYDPTSFLTELAKYIPTITVTQNNGG